jgi:flagellar hook-associated protein 2
MPAINFSGIASGIDTNALIQAQTDAQRRVRIEPSSKKVQELEETNSALTEFKSLLQNIKKKAGVFSSLSGGGVSKIGTSSDESTATAVASNSAQAGVYTISSVTSIAKNHVISYDKGYTNTSSPLDSTLVGTTTVDVTIGTLPQDSFSIPIDSTTTLAEFVDDFNAATSDASASLINVGTSSLPDYRVVITSARSGLDKGQLSLTLNGGANFGTIQEDPASDAVFELAGINGTITRSSNTINDLVAGLTFELQKTNASPTKITVSTDPTTTISRVKELVDAFNDAVTFVSEDNQIVREEDGQDVQNIFGSLASTRTDDSAIQSIRDAFSSSTYSGGSLIRIFADLGVKTERNGLLTLDEDKLEEAVTNEPDSVSKVLENFAETAASTGGTIDDFAQFNGLLDVSTRNNQTRIDNLNRRIADAESSLARLEEALRARYARLESLIGRLQSQQNSLSAALGSGGG